MDFPIYSGSPNDPAPHLYRIQRHTQLCAHCGRRHCYTTVWAQTHLRPLSQTPTGRYVSNLRAVRTTADIQWNIPVHCVDLKAEEIPFCHDCYTTVTLNHLLVPPVEERLPANPLAATPGWRKAQAAADEAKKRMETKAKARKAIEAASLDDIL